MIIENLTSTKKYYLKLCIHNKYKKYVNFMRELWYRADFSVEINELLKTKRLAIFIETIQYTEYIQFTLQVIYT